MSFGGFPGTANFFKRNKILLLLIIAGILWELFVFIRFPKQAWVEGLLEAWYAYKGLVFYKDFTTTYLPFLHLIMVPFHMLFGFTQFPTIVLSPIISITTFLLLIYFSWKFLSGWIRFIPPLFFLFWDPILNENHFSTASFQGLINLLIFIIWIFWFRKPKRIYSFWIGFFSSINFLSLQMVAPFIGIISISLLYRYFKKEARLDSLLTYSLGFLIPVLMVLIYFLSKNALWDLYYWNILYYLQDYPYAESLGRGFTNTLIFFAVFSPLISFTIPAYLLVKKKFFERLELFSINEYFFIFLSIFSLTLTFWFAIFHPVRFQIGMPLSAILLGIYLHEFIRHKKLFISNLLILLFIGLLNIWVSIEYIIPKYESMFNHPQKYPILTAVYQDDPMFETIKWIKSHTKEMDKIIVLADPLFYLETNRLPAHRRATKNLPFLWMPLDGLDDELRKSPIAYWVIDERLIQDRFVEYGYPLVSDFFIEAYKCDPIVFQYEYFIIRKRQTASEICV